MRKRLNNRPLGLSVALLAMAAMLALGGAGLIQAGEKDSDGESSYLGVFMQDLTDDVREGLDLKTKSGVLISGVADGSPAEEAGIEDGDIIVEFNGKKVDSADDLKDLVEELEPGTKVKIQLVRDGDKKTVTATLGELPDDFFQWFSGDNFDFDFDGDSFIDMGHHMRGDWSVLTESIGRPRLGVRVTELGEDLAAYFDAEAESGVLVLDVSDDTVADDAGVKAGDVIQKIGDESVSTARELRQSLQDYEKGDEFAIQVLRKGKTEKLSATMDEHGYAFRIHRGPRAGMRKHFRAPRVHIDRQELHDDLRKEMDELREELKDLKKELNKS